MDRFKRLYQGQPDVGGDLLYTVPSNFSAIVRDVEIINIDDTDSDWMIIWLLPPGISVPSDEYIIRPRTTLGPGESLPWTGTRTMEADCKLYAQTGGGAGSLAVLNLVITGMEVDEVTT